MSAVFAVFARDFHHCGCLMRAGAAAWHRRWRGALASRSRRWHDPCERHVEALEKEYAMNLHSTLACAAAMAATIATLAVLAHPIDAARTITIDVDEAPPVAATLLPTLRVSADPSGLTRVELGAEEPLPVVLLPTVQVRA
ncbi:MAG: hypothetical protein IT477_04680, partial [Rhodanobacteraceae bacterium]|nr:hypothetical protein [Rhodanobacteraceae bacterium]